MFCFLFFLEQLFYVKSFEEICFEEKPLLNKFRAKFRGRDNFVIRFLLYFIALFFPLAFHNHLFALFYSTSYYDKLINQCPRSKSHSVTFLTLKTTALKLLITAFVRGYQVLSVQDSIKIMGFGKIFNDAENLPYVFQLAHTDKTL